MAYVQSPQKGDHSFPGGTWVESDTIFSHFPAVLTCGSPGQAGTMDVGKAVEFVVSCMNFDDGFEHRPGSGSHAGQIYCCIRSLAIITIQLHQVNSD